MLLECDAPCEGFCLATWETVNVSLARKGRRNVETIENWRTRFTYLPACNYIHLLEETSAASEADDGFELRRLFDLLSQRSQCREGAKQLLKESTGENLRVTIPYFPSLTL